MNPQIIPIRKPWLALRVSIEGQNAHNPKYSSLPKPRCTIIIQPNLGGGFYGYAGGSWNIGIDSSDAQEGVSKSMELEILLANMNLLNGKRSQDLKL